MFKKFIQDKNGNYALITALVMAPLMGAVALAVDYTELSRQRYDTRNALDAANIATARQIQSGATDEEAKAYAENFFLANLQHVLPSKTKLHVTLPNNSSGGGTMTMCADLVYSPYFMPAAAHLIGRTSKDVNFTTCSEVRLKNTLEVALVLDNSGSMSYNGTGTGQQRMALLKTAAKQLVDTLALQAQQMKQINKPVQFSLVPFAASVNVGPEHDGDSWMDTTGISPIHHENFDWSGMTKTNDPNKYAEKVGDAWYKRGTGWGDTENEPLTRFSLYADMTVESGREEVPNSQQYVCTKYKGNGKCKNGYWTDPDYVYTTSQFASWQGCVEARPYPYNDNDFTPTTSTPASLFVPMFAPDEAGTIWRDFDNDGNNDVNSVDYSYGNNWWADWIDYAQWAKKPPYNFLGTLLGGIIPTVHDRQADMRKYFLVKPYNSASASSGRGPNYSCTTNPITPLQDVKLEAGKDIVKDAIDAMQPGGNTNVPEGLAWGWRTVSSGEPFTQGRPEIEKGNDKVIILLTDGANTYTSDNDSYYANNRSTYAAYGYTGVNYQSTGMTRMFLNTSNDVGKTTHSSSNFTTALDEQMQTLCSNAKNSKVIIMTVSLDLSTSKSSEKKAIAALKECAGESRFRKDPDDPSKPAKLYWNATGATLSDDFKEIADELSNLRIVS